MMYVMANKVSSAAAAAKRLVEDVKKHSSESVAPPPQKEKEFIPELRDAITNRGQLLMAQRLINEYVLHQETVKTAEAAKKRLSPQIKDILGKADVGKCNYDGRRINYISVPRYTISKDLLLAANVKPQVIVDCTETTYSLQLRITAIKEDEEAEG